MSSDLDVDNTSINGTLPTELGLLTMLGEFDVGQCRLTGTLPSELGKMTALSLLGLNTNQFSGTIPREFANLQNVEQISLAGNRLSGTVPSELATLPNLGKSKMCASGETHLGGILKSCSLSLSLSFSHVLSPNRDRVTEQLLVHNNELIGSLDPFCNAGLDIILRADCELPAEITCTCCETCY